MRNIRKHYHIDKEYLQREYIDKKRSAFDIAKENNVRAKFIIQRLKRFQIIPRNIKESNSSTISLEKRKNTCKKIYGVDNVSKSKEIIDKIKKNVDISKKSKSISISLKKRTREEWKESARKRAITFLQKYEVENVSQLSHVRRKMRVSAIRRIRNQLIDGGQIYPAYNINACKIIDEYGKQHGYNFQHAMCGGEFYLKELGYWVDGYDKEKNVVIEIDESHHFDSNGILIEKDIKRQKEIEEFLKCKFIRIKNL